MTARSGLDPEWKQSPVKEVFDGMKKAAAWMLCLFLALSVLAVSLAGEAVTAG